MNPSLITDMASAFYDSCILFTASDAGVFDYLAAHPESKAEDIAAGLSLNPRGARLLLDGAAALGLLLKEGGYYRNSPEAEMFLTEGSPACLKKAIRYNRDVYEAWGRLPELTRTGRPVEKPEVHLGDDETRTRNFVLSMHGRALGIGRAVLPLLDLDGCRQLFDVGGGPGTYSVLIAQKHPDMQCTVLDLPEVVKVAGELIEQQGMSDRVHTLAGDYHTAPFPDGIDAVNFFGMLHQESVASIRDLLSRTYAVLKPGGVVHILDMMTDASHTQPKFSALFAVNMALTTENGWVFSADEMMQWLAEAGFMNAELKKLPPPMPHWMIRAEK